MFKSSIPLGSAGFRIFLYQPDHGIHPLIGKGMGKLLYRFFVMGISKSKSIDILTIAVIIIRGLQFFQIITVSKRKVCLIHCRTVCPCNCLLDQGILLYNHNPACVQDIISCKQTIPAASKGIFCFPVFFHNRNFRFLAVIGKGYICKYHTFILACIA